MSSRTPSSPCARDVSAAPIIPIHDWRDLPVPISTERPESMPTGVWKDQLQRPLRDLRISVTDRCNFRCSYCMPKEVFDQNYRYLPHASLLRFEEIQRLARLFVAQGVQKIRLTGGEPLLRKDLDHLIRLLATLRTPEGKELDLTLTTNGSLLTRKAQALKDAGLKRLTVSLDALDDTIFQRMNDVNYPVADVLQGIETAQAVGLGHIKINMVVKRGTNEQEILPMARYFRERGMTLRFIEYMDVGTTNGWRMDEVLPSGDIVRLLQQHFSLIPLSATHQGETAQRFGYTNAQGQHDPSLGEVGFISSVTQAFCRDCNRARLSTEGKLYLCLFAHQGHDLRALLRDPKVSDEDITHALAHIWHARQDRYSELRSQGLVPATSGHTQRIEMSYIGG